MLENAILSVIAERFELALDQRLPPQFGFERVSNLGAQDEIETWLTAAADYALRLQRPHGASKIAAHARRETDEAEGALISKHAKWSQLAD